MKMLYENRSAEDKKFIQIVCHDILRNDVIIKDNSDDFCGIYVEGRGRTINCLEDWATIVSFKVFSKFNYPLFAFINNKKDFLDNNFETMEKWRIKVIKIPQLNNLDEYTNFCVKELYHLIPDNIKYAVHLQPDAALLKNGWEDEIIKNDWVYVGSPWTHAPAIEIQNKDGNWEDFGRPVRVGNGGFSVRSVDFCRFASNYYSKFNLREKFAPNNKIPPEDLFYSVIASNLTINVPTVEEANNFCCDPLTPEKYKSGRFFGFHYFLNK